MNSEAIYESRVEALSKISHEEKTDLLRKAKAGDREALNRIVESNIKLVWHFANKYKRDGCEVSDLIQAGTLGLIRAVEKFDPDRGFKLSTYAAPWIMNFIQRHLQEERNIQIPAYMLEAIYKFKKVRDNLSVELGRDAFSSEICEKMGIRENLFKSVIEAEKIMTESSLDKNISAENGDESLSLSDVIATEEEHPDTAFILNEKRQKVREAVSRLSTREAQIISMKYGLGDEDPMTLNSIGDKIGLSDERVRQISGRALVRLRAIMGSPSSEQDDIIPLPLPSGSTVFMSDKIKDDWKKNDSEIWGLLLEEIKKGATISAACKTVGISQNTYYKYRKNNPIYSDEIETAYKYSGEKLAVQWARNDKTNEAILPQAPLSTHVVDPISYEQMIMILEDKKKKIQDAIDAIRAVWEQK